MIVVTAPTGQIGAQLLRRLLASDQAVRVIARDSSRLSDDLRERVEVVEGSHGDAGVADEALAGADALFWLVPPDPHAASLTASYMDFTRPACAAIVRHGVRHVVGISALGRGTPWADRAGFVTASIGMDDLLAGTGAAYRGLAVPSFMDNLLRQTAPIGSQGMFFGPIDADRKMPHTATRDIAAVAARLLVERSWSGQADMPLLGPEDLSCDDQAAILSDVLGKPVRYRQLPFDAFEAQLRRGDVSDAFVRGYVEMMRAKNEGLDNGRPRDADTATPTTFRLWCKEVLKPRLRSDLG